MLILWPLHLGDYIFLKILGPSMLVGIRGRTNCPVFVNCSVFCDVWEVRSSVLGKKVMFGGVRSSVLMFGELSEHLG